jgi:polyferredoxin
MARRARRAPRPRHAKLIWHARTLIYLGLWSAIGCAALCALAREHLAISVAKDRNPPFMLMSDGAIRNAYLVKWRNMEDRPRPMRLTLDGIPGARCGARIWARLGGPPTRPHHPADQTEPLRSM